MKEVVHLPRDERGRFGTAIPFAPVVLVLTPTPVLPIVAAAAVIVCVAGALFWLLRPKSAPNTASSNTEAKPVYPAFTPVRYDARR